MDPDPDPGGPKLYGSWLYKKTKTSNKKNQESPDHWKVLKSIHFPKDLEEAARLH
jgi:hypothetical protein